jgi:hypothetical protein
MKLSIETKVSYISDTTRDEFSEIVNLFFTIPIENINITNMNLHYGSWFFYRGNNHIAVHQRYTSGKVYETRVLFVEF